MEINTIFNDIIKKDYGILKTANSYFYTIIPNKKPIENDPDICKLKTNAVIKCLTEPGKNICYKEVNDLLECYNKNNLHNKNNFKYVPQ